MGQEPMPGDQPDTSDSASTDTAGSTEAHAAVTPMRASIAMMIVGALVLFVGMLSTTAASPQPECPTGTELVAKFEVKGNSYVFEKPAGNETVVELIYPTLTGGNWTSTTPISVVIVKGGPGSKATTYDPAQLQGTFSNAELPEVGKGNLPDISNIQFCAPPTPVTTTTTVPSTSSTNPYDTTTTTEATTTTDPYDTTTTTEESTTTTSEATTTTEESTTTTSEATTTTEESTTTTTEGTTTTEDDSTTTTAADGTTTTERADVAGRVEVATKVTPNDAEVRSGALAFTGGSSVPLLVIGIVLLLSGATLALVTRARSRQAAG